MHERRVQHVVMRTWTVAALICIMWYDGAYGGIGH